MSVVFREAFRYPWNDREEANTTVLLGGLLTFFTFLVVPQIILLGYFVRVLRGTSRGDETPPTFDRWRELLVDGTKAYVIWLGWTVIPLFVRFGLNGGHLEPGQATFWLLGWMLAPNVISFLQRGADTSGFLDGFGFSEPYVDLLIVLYIIPAALANFAEHGTIRSGFFDGGLKRYLDWILGLVRHIAPRVADLAARMIDRLLSDSEFAPVSTFTRPQYAIGWLGFFFLYLAGEAVLRTFLYLPAPGGVFTWLNMIYLFGALLAYFYLRVAGWSIIGRIWPAVRPAESSIAAHAPPSGEGDRETLETIHRYVRSDGLLAGLTTKTVFVGGLLITFSIVILPGLLVGGYLVHVVRETVNDEDIPSFGGIRELLADGAKAYGIWFGYTVLPASLLFIAIAQRMDAGSALGNLAAWGVVVGVGLPGGFPAVVLFLLGGGVALVVLLLGITLLPSALLVPVAGVLATPIPIAIVLFVLAVYVVPAALLNVAAHGSLRAGFALRSLLPTLRRGEYAVRAATTILLTLPGWMAVFGTNLLLAHPLFGDTPLVEPVAGLEYLTFFSVPTSVSALLFWGLLITSGVVYFVLLVVSCRIIGRLEVDPHTRGIPADRRGRRNGDPTEPAP